MAQTMPDAGEGIEGLERWEIGTTQGVVEAWFVPGRGVSSASPGPAVVFAHGNAEVMDDYAYVLAPYAQMGVSLLLVEFRGYGRSEGSPSQARITEDFVKAYDRLADRPEVDRSRIVFHGRSVGTGVVCSLARRRAPAALILQSPFLSARRMMGRYLIPPFLSLDPFDNAATVSAFDGPVLIMHGDHDEVIPFSHGKRLHAMTRRGKFSVYDCGHNDFPMDSGRYWEDIRVFLEEAEINVPGDRAAR